MDPIEHQENKAGLAELHDKCAEHMRETAVNMQNFWPDHPLTLEAFGTVLMMADAVHPEDTDPMQVLVPPCIVDWCT